MKHGNSQKGRIPVLRERLLELQGDMTNTEFADKLGISRQTAGFYLNGDRIPDSETLLQICKSCKVSADWLLGLSDDPNMNPPAVDELGLNPTVVSGIKELNNRKRNDDSTTGIATIDVLDQFLEKSLCNVSFFEMVRDLKSSVDRERNAKPSSIIPEGLAEFAAANTAHERMVIEAMLRSKIRDEYPELNDRFLVVFGTQSLKPRVDEICDSFREMLENITGYKQLKER